MTGLFLSRARLRRDTGAVAALARLLVPDGAGPRTAAAHRLVWALFADTPGRQRDFLWREEAPGRFMTLSIRPPAALDLFEVDSKPFEPCLVAGDRLEFALRANAVIARPQAPGQRGKRHDVVMDALCHMPEGQRAETRWGIMIDIGRTWLARQGAAHGFIPSNDVGVDGYEQIEIARGNGRTARFSQLEFSGALTVTDPAAFLTALAAGFGRARAFGCGLMLIRRG